MKRFGARRPRTETKVPFVFVAPAVVFLLGTLVVAALGALGYRELHEWASGASSRRASLVARSVQSELERTPGSAREAKLDELAQRTGAILILEDSQGEPFVRAAPKRPPQSTLTHAVPFGRDGSKLVVLSPPYDPSEARATLLGALGLFAILVLAASVFVAWTLARDVQADLLFLRGVVKKVVQEGTPEAGLIPVRTIDQVGQLTASFNMLLERFYAAERAYRADLAGANAFDKDRSAFLAALSHELRTPLNGILGFTDVLLSELDGPLSDEARENLSIVRTSAEHLRSLIDDVLAFSALEAGEFRLSREDLDLYLVASDVVTEARLTASQKNIQVELAKDDSEGPTFAQADRRRMRQVLQNVVSNAIKFTSQGKVRVEVKRKGSEVHCIITDTGPGIPKADLETIFREFEQSSAGAAQRTGTGLGLAITRRLTDLHSGRVEVESEPGHGAKFTIAIPVVASVDISIPPHPRLSQAPSPELTALDETPGAPPLEAPEPPEALKEPE